MADDLDRRLVKLVQAEIDRESDNGKIPPTLPDLVDLNRKELDLYFDLWAKWRFLYDRQFTIKQILEEPEEESNAVMEIESRYNTLLRIARTQANG